MNIVEVFAVSQIVVETSKHNQPFSGKFTFMYILQNNFRVFV